MGDELHSYWLKMFRLLTEAIHEAGSLADPGYESSRSKQANLQSEVQSIGLHG